MLFLIKEIFPFRNRDDSELYVLTGLWNQDIYVNYYMYKYEASN